MSADGTTDCHEQQLSSDVEVKAGLNTLAKHDSVRHGRDYHVLAQQSRP